MAKKPVHSIGLQRVESFIRHELRSKLSADLHGVRMVKEADLECCTYYHLRRFFHDDSQWTVLSRIHVPQTGYYTDILIFKNGRLRIAVELKWDRTQISRKDRDSLRRSIDTLGVNRAYFIATNTKPVQYRKIKKVRLEKRSLIEIAVPLDLKGKPLELWKTKRHAYRSDMRTGKGRKLA